MAKTTTLDLPSFYRSSVGFDRLFDELNSQLANSTQSGYPPYDVTQHGDNEYTVTLAVAGFTMDELTVTKEKNVLRIGGHSETSDLGTRYLHHGIAKRDFTREFTLADHVDVVNATLDLGLLTVHLKREVPEEERPKQISISSSTKSLSNDTE